MSDEVTKEALLENLAAFDRGEDVDTAKTVKTEEPAPDKKDAAVKDDKASQPNAKDAPKENPDTPKDDSAKKTDDSADKNTSKWAKNEERKSRTWQELNADKEALRKEREELAKARAEIDQARKAAMAKEPVRDEHGATVQDYREAAKQYRAAGKADFADAAEKLAEKLATHEQQVTAQRTFETQQRQWADNYAKLSDTKPELKDPASDLYKATVKALEDFPVLRQTPEGIVYAVKAAELNLQARNFDGTKKELDALKEAHSKLQKKLSIGSGTPTETLPEDKPFDSMSLAEQRKALEQAAHSLDRAAGFD
jgi:hypothetical protein